MALLAVARAPPEVIEVQPPLDPQLLNLCCHARREGLAAQAAAEDLLLQLEGGHCVHLAQG